MVQFSGLRSLNRREQRKFELRPAHFVHIDTVILSSRSRVNHVGGPTCLFAAEVERFIDWAPVKREWATADARGRKLALFIEGRCAQVF